MSSQQANNPNSADGPLDPSHAMVEVKPASGGLPMASPFGGMGAPQGNDVLKGGMDHTSFFHSLRRRWLLATCMSLLIGSATAATLFVLFPESFDATAQYKVESSPLTLLDDDAANQTRDFDIFKATQIAYIRSPFVLNAALRESGVSTLPMFEGIQEVEKAQWLSDAITVAYPNDGEILQISMSGDYEKEDLKRVVEAVSKAYWEEVVFRERNIRQRPLEILRKSYSRLNDQLQAKMRQYQQLAEDSGTSAAYEDGFDPETQLMLTEVSEILKQKTKLEARLVEMSMQYRVFEQQMRDPSFLESQIDAALANDPSLAQLQQEIAGLDIQIRTAQSYAKRGASKTIQRLYDQRQRLQGQLNQTREQMRAQFSSSQGAQDNPQLRSAITQFQVSQQTIGGDIQRHEQRLTELQEQLLEKAKNNTDLLVRMAEIDQLKSVEAGIASKIQNLQVELQAPERIQPIGANSSGAAIAETSESRNKVTRIAISGAGGLGTLLLTCLGIGYMEFTGRRLNGPEQVDEGLGLRVIGTLPSLSGRKALNPRHPVVAQLNESIDGVRTALMHESTSKPRRVVLVTSPTAGEGRTTVASQLAASLARAGRRTLLVDGDLRRPSLHALFNEPLEDGLCEVLRAEAEITDVIRPTRAEGLWLLTAGYCEGDAVRALSTDQAQPIFDKLRADYDFVVIDGAPVLGLSDSLLFGQHCDGAVLSVLRDQSCVPKIHQATQLLKGVGIRLIGSIVNGVPTKADRRVTHLQQVTPKSEQKQLETAQG